MKHLEQATENISKWPQWKKNLAGIIEPIRANGYVVMPAKLTAENGAKAALIGEFFVPFPITCPVCQGDDDGEYCENCENSGEVKLEVNVPWTVIKDIYSKAVEHFNT